MLWNAYTWVIISTLLAIPFLKPTKDQWKDIVTKWLKRAPGRFSRRRSFLHCLCNDVLGYMPQSGGWALVNMESNMISVLALGSADLFSTAYAV